MSTAKKRDNNYQELSKTDLVKLLKNRDIELTQLKQSQIRDAFSPAAFLQDYMREEFWDKIRVSESFSSDRYEMMSQFQSQAQKQQRSIQEKDQKINQLVKVVEEEGGFKAKLVDSNIQINNLQQEVEKNRSLYEDYHAKTHYSVRERDILKEKVEFYESNFNELEKFFQKSVRQYQSERRKLTERIATMSKTNKKKTGLLKIASEFRATEIFYSKDNEYNIDQIILRFNTVSPESQKFLDLLNLIKDFYNLVKLEMKELELKVVLTNQEIIEKRKVEKLLKLLTSSKMCGNYTKGLKAHDYDVFTNTVSFITSLGPMFIKANLQHFSSSQIISRICQTLSMSFNFSAKTGHAFKKAMKKPNFVLDAITEIEQVRNNKGQNAITSGKEMENLALQAITKQKLKKGESALNKRNNLNNHGDDESKAKDSYRFQKMLLALTAQLVDLSDKFRSSFILLGGVQFILSSLQSTIDPIFINSDFYYYLLQILAKILPEADNLRDFKNNELLQLIIKLLRECYNKDSIGKVLEILDGLSEDYFLRIRLNQLKVFGDLLKFYGEAWNSRDLQMLFKVFILFGKFTREMSFKIQLISHLELDNDFSALFEPFKEENQDITSAKIKAASLEIIRNLILNGPSEELREMMAKSSFLKTLLKNALDDDDNTLKSFALDCLLSVNDLVSEGIMPLDDLVFDLDKIFNNQHSAIQSKLLLFISWGLLTDSIDISLIRQSFLSNVIDNGFDALEKGESERFKRSNFVITLLLEKDTWSEILLAMQYYEKYLTSRVNNKKKTRRAWLQGLSLLASHTSFITTIRANPNLLKFVWFEISEHCHDMNLEVVMLVKSTITLPEMLDKYNDEVFLSKLLRGFIDSYHTYPNDKLIMTALEVFYGFCRSPAAIKVYLKNKAFHKFLKRLWSKVGTSLNRLTVRIYMEMIAQASDKELKYMIDEEFIDSFKILLQGQSALQIEAFTSNIILNLEQKDIIPEGEFQKTSYTEEDLIAQIPSVFEPRELLLEDSVEQMMEDFIDDFRKM